MAKSKNIAREQKILETAADLFVQYGYDKTTVSDIARGAGISQGAIYLHFESKDALLEALILHEMETYAEEWLARIEADPKGGTIGGMYKNMLYALNRSPFMTATFKQDGHVMGAYLRKPDNFFRQAHEKGSESSRYMWVTMMQEAGQVRQDIAPEVIAHILNMVAYGLVALDDVIPKETMPPFEEVVEGIAKIMDRALTSDDGADSEIGKAILRQIAEVGRQDLDAQRNPDGENDNGK